MRRILELVELSHQSRHFRKEDTVGKKKRPSVKDTVEMTIGMSIAGMKPGKLLVAMHGKKVQRKNVMPW